MPFIRQTRDKRGFEYTYVMHTYHPGASNGQRPRLLYLFRSPASVRLGRTALDAEVMEALEHTHPDLSFDWQVLSRDATVTRAENANDRQPQQPQQRRRPDDRSSKPRFESRSPDSRSPGPSGPGNGPGSEDPGLRQPREADLPPDDSVLGRVLGVAEAARMRRRYADLLQRIARRARTPEDRERLTERLKRLNPEDWSDEAAVRANAPSADAGWNAISGELPSRRRGRRGGRGRADNGERPSGIMASAHQSTVEAADEGLETTDIAGPGGDGGSHGARGTVAADPDQEAPADPDVPFGD